MSLSLRRHLLMEGIEPTSGTWDVRWAASWAGPRTPTPRRCRAPACLNSSSYYVKIITKFVRRLLRDLSQLFFPYQPLRRQACVLIKTLSDRMHVWYLHVCAIGMAEAWIPVPLHVHVWACMFVPVNVKGLHASASAYLGFTCLWSVCLSACLSMYLIVLLLRCKCAWLWTWMNVCFVFSYIYHRYRTYCTPTQIYSVGSFMWPFLMSSHVFLYKHFWFWLQEIHFRSCACFAQTSYVCMPLCLHALSASFPVWCRCVYDLHVCLLSCRRVNDLHVCLLSCRYVCDLHVSLVSCRRVSQLRRHYTQLCLLTELLQCMHVRPPCMPNLP